MADVALLEGPGRPSPLVVTPTTGATPILIQYWQVILRWKFVIIGIIASFVMLGLVVTLLATPRYTSTARIEISRDQKNITKVEGLESAATTRDQEFYQTQYALLIARSLAERVVRQLRLDNDTAFFEAQEATPATPDSIGGNETAANRVDLKEVRRKQAADLLMANIAIVPVRGSSLVDVRFTSANPAVSAKIANAWTQQFIAASIDRKFESTSDARRFLEERLADLRTRLERSEKDLVSYANNKGIVALSRTQGADGKTQNERTLVAADLEALNSALSQSVADRVTAESKLRSAGGNSTDALGNAAIAEMRQRRAEAAAEYAKLLVQFEPGYPTARALQEQVRSLDSAIAREEKRVTSVRWAEYQEASQREANLANKVRELKSRLGRQQQDSIQYNIYMREADTNRQLYDALLQRYKEIGVAGVGANNISIVDLAQVPEGPSSPNLLLNLAAALFIGIGVAGVATLGLDQIDEGLRDPADVQRLLGMPLLGAIPDVEESPLELIDDAKSTLSEAYLSIRSNLAFSTDHGLPRSLMLTSTRPAEGKSTSALALAIVVGRTGKRVLMIDSDMRSPSVNGFLSIGNTKGLSNYLAGEADWRSFVQSTSIKGLSVMTAGPMPPSAGELLSSDRMSQLVKEALDQFDHIVVDAPPILGLADAPLLSRAVEGCVFVIEAEGVSVRAAKSSLARLQAVQAHVVGVILTKLNIAQSGYGYGYGYGYGKDRQNEQGHESISA